MEKFGLVDKTKEELIDIALEQERVENKLRGELDDANSHVVQLTKEVNRASRFSAAFCIVYILMSIYIVFMILEK